MKHIFQKASFAAALTASIAFAPIAGASSLTQAQISAIINLLQAFGADASTIASVQTTLTGGTPVPSTGQWCHTFNMNLRIGDSTSERDGSGDTMSLQQALTKEGFSISESEYNGRFVGKFGESTAAAVTGFQEKYKDEILTPAGLAHGTGYVGAGTRSKLNRLYGCNSMPTPSTSPTASNGISFKATPTTGEAPLAVKFSLELYAEQNMPGYTVDFGDGTTGTFTSACTPDGYAGCSSRRSSSHIYNAGTYIARLLSTCTSSSNSCEKATVRGTATITVSQSNTTTSPSITSITPTTAHIGDTLTVVGNNLLSHTTQVWVSREKGDGVEIWSGLPTSNTQISFTIPSSVCSISVGDSGKPCPSSRDIMPGFYTVSIYNANGWSNSFPFAITLQ